MPLDLSLIIQVAALSSSVDGALFAMPSPKGRREVDMSFYDAWVIRRSYLKIVLAQES